MSIDLNTPLPSPHGGTIGSWTDRIHTELAGTQLLALFRSNDQDCKELRFCKSPKETVEAIVGKATTYIQDPQWVAQWLTFYCVNSPRAFNPRILLRILSRRAFLQAFAEIATTSTNPVTLETTLENRPKVSRTKPASTRPVATRSPASVGNFGPADPALLTELGITGTGNRSPNPGGVSEVPSPNPESKPVPAPVPTPNPAATSK